MLTYLIGPLAVVSTFCDATVLIFPSPHNFVHSSGVIRLTIFDLVSTFGGGVDVAVVIDEFAIKMPTGFCLMSPFLPAICAIEFDAAVVTVAVVCFVIEFAFEEFCTLSICFPNSVTTI